MFRDRMVVALTLSLVALAMCAGHVRGVDLAEQEAAEVARLDALGCVGFVAYDPSIMKFTFYGRH